MKTKETVVTQTLNVYAVPDSNIELGFTFCLKEHSHWDDDAVKIYEQSVTVTVPDGIDLVAAAIDTLKERKEKLVAETYKKKMRLEEKIQALMTLEHKPEKPMFKEESKFCNCIGTKTDYDAGHDVTRCVVCLKEVNDDDLPF